MGKPSVSVWRRLWQQLLTIHFFSWQPKDALILPLPATFTHQYSLRSPSSTSSTFIRSIWWRTC